MEILKVHQNSTQEQYLSKFYLGLFHRWLFEILTQRVLLFAANDYWSKISVFSLLDY